MSSTDRQNRLLIAEDWKKIYQTFRNADFQSYDFENLRRVMVNYIRTNYPEDFNDYIESSEYLALIDIIAFLGQSIAFRVDLNARENFLELAERRESILRLARLVSYNAKRNIPAQGLLKIATIQTTEILSDSNGRNLANQIISWNDASNPNWYDQFIKVINSAFSSNQQFGNPSDKNTIQGIPTSQYRFQAVNTDVPVYSFTKAVAGRTMNFEVTSTSFSGENYIYEEPPKVGNSIACIYRDDGRGSGSANTGFFFNFVQGSLNTGTFTITQPSTNETVDISSQGINNNDVWLYRLDSNGLESELWSQVPSFEGNNVIYNSLSKHIRDIYGITTRAGDSISLNFSDGTFGNTPLGTFRTYYRISNGLNYTINPQDIRSVLLSIPYASSKGQLETLSITLNLTSAVSNSSSAETNNSIKANAPANYYTQNRMITGEDYNISPLSVSQQVAKVKAVNRTSSGISRYFDLVDPSGKYSSTRLFADDGVIYKEEYTSSFKFTYTSRSDIDAIINTKIIDILSGNNIRNYFYSKYINYVKTGVDIQWNTVQVDSNSSSGFLGSYNQVLPVGTFTTTDLKYITVGSLVKFTAPTGWYFDTTANNTLVYGVANKNGSKTDIWASIVSVVDDGRATGTGKLSDGSGPIRLNQSIPYNPAALPQITQIIPKWRTAIDKSIIATMNDLIFSNKPFGLRYDASSQTWQIIFETNLDSQSNFSLGNQGIETNKNQDSSWIMLFTTDNEYYTVVSRESRFIFESDSQIRFYIDGKSKIYDSKSNSNIIDNITILSINNKPNSTSAFTTDVSWDIVSEYIGLDGYIDNKKVVITFSDSDNNGIVDDPESFIQLVDPSNTQNSYVITQKYLISDGQEDYKYVSNSDNKVIILQTKPYNIISYKDGQYFYFVDTDTVMKLSLQRGIFLPSLDYKVYEGRDNLKFKYIHNADYESRIDPGTSNIIDIFVLSKSYDIAYRQWVNGAFSDEPKPMSTDEMYNTLSPSLNLIKATSDEIVYHPVEYKLLFGKNALPELQATFKVIKNDGYVISDNDVKSQIIIAINQFFSIENWDFGDTFYFSELSTYVMNQVAPAISSFVIVPSKSGLNFGSLFEITSANNQIFINGASVDDIQIITGITSSNIKSVSGTSSISTAMAQQTIISSNYGSL